MPYLSLYYNGYCKSDCASQICGNVCHVPNYAQVNCLMQQPGCDYNQCNVLPKV
jgi:hypothetical protein